MCEEAMKNSGYSKARIGRFAPLEAAMSTRRIDSLDEQLIRMLPRYLGEAWNRGDSPSYAALFTDDCDYIGFDGTHVTGRAATARHHQKLFDSVMFGSRLRLADITIRFVTPDLALIHADASLSMPWQSADARKHRWLQSYIVVRNDDGWRIAAFQSAEVRPLSFPRGVALRLLRAFFRLRTLLAAGRLEPAGGL
jgi:uncharacterized protein (TIGR02246 family)